jgi:glycerol kinase
MQFQADVLGVPVVVPEISETTALGAAYLAGVATGLWDEAGTRRMWREAARYEPRMSADERESLLEQWSRAVERSRAWVSPDADAG